MTSKLVVNTIEADTGISSVSFGSSISLSSTSKFFFGAAGIDIGADTNINRPASGVLGFNINGSERARINSSGRLGLGTNNPDTTLTVQSGGDAQMSLKNSSGTTKAYVGTAGAFGSAGTDDLRIRSDSSNIIFGFSGAERLRIKSDGSVGVGTDTPIGQFHLHKASTSVTQVLECSSGAASFQVKHTNGYGTVNFWASGTEKWRVGQTGTSSDFNIWDVPNSADRLRISSVGELTSTAAQANVATFTSNQTASTIYVKDTDGDGIFISGSSAYGHRIYTNTTEDLLLGFNSTEKIRITNGGLDPSTDAATDLGNSSKRFRDLYLSSGVFLGGTTSSNELEDYEEGTYVPSTNTGLTLNSGYNTFSYIKIGRVCTVRGLFFPNNNPSGGHNMTISLPFASYNYTGSGASLAGAGGSGVMYRSISGADAGVAVYVNDNSSTATFYKNGSNGGAWSPVYNNDWNSGLEIYIDVTYFTV